MMQQLFRIYSLRIFGEKVSRVFERGYIFFFRKSLDLKKREKRERERRMGEIRAFLLDAPFDRLIPVSGLNYP